MEDIFGIFVTKCRRLLWERDICGTERKMSLGLLISLVAGAHNAKMARKCRELYFEPKNDLQLLPVSEAVR